MSGSYASSTVGSSHSEERKMDEFDEKMIKAIKDVKFQQRPKFLTFGDVTFQRECLDAHNSLRLRYGCPPLIWSQELADLASDWCHKLTEKQRILYPELPGVGENIELMVASDSTHLLTGEEVTAKWAKQADKFNFDKPIWRTDCQHFTQMIWKDSQDFGASRSWNQSTNMLAIVAFYRPAGNSNCPGEFVQNVPKPLDGKPYLPENSSSTSRQSTSSMVNCTENTTS